MLEISMPLFAFVNMEEVLKGGTVLLAIRIAFSVFGAILGYFLSGPIWALLHRLVFRKAIDGLLFGLLRLGSAALVAAVLFFFLPPGFGGGWGLGGPGGSGIGGPGDGKGKGKGDNDVDGQENKNEVKPGRKKTKENREEIEIELIDGKRFRSIFEKTKERKYYLLKRKDPPLSLSEVDAYLKDNKDKIEDVRIVSTDKSVIDVPNSKDEQPEKELRELCTKKYEIPVR